MFRLVLLVTLLAAAACHKEPPPSYAEQPLPPASGTPIGYLIDNAGQLALTPEQVSKLQSIDDSLAARNDAIDTQLREIERPEPEEPPGKNEPPRPPPNMAPGAGPMRTTKDAGKLHEARSANSKEALEKAFAILEHPQQENAKKLLDARGISSPKLAKPAPATIAAPPPVEPATEPMPPHEP